MGEQIQTGISASGGVGLVITGLLKVENEIDLIPLDFPLINCASLAPASHNTPPRKFSVRDEEIRIFAHKARWLEVADADQRELHISVGCALKNLLKGEGQDLSCIIMESFYFETPDGEFLEEAKKGAHRYGLLFILDEVKSGDGLRQGSPVTLLCHTGHIRVQQRNVQWLPFFDGCGQNRDYGSVRLTLVCWNQFWKSGRYIRGSGYHPRVEENRRHKKDL